MKFKRLLPALFFLLLLAPAAHPRPDEPAAKNVIVMIADGAGYDTWAATGYWLGEAPFSTGEGWVRVGKACHALRTSGGPNGQGQDPATVYDPRNAWSEAPIDLPDGKYPTPFSGYRWLKATAPDSAATMTAMMTGSKTYNGAINVDAAGKPLTSLAELLHRRGKAVGVVTSVPLSHATPAAGAGAHHVTRGAYPEIANEMLESGILDVIIGAGHPWFDDDSEPRPAPLPGRAYRYVGGRDTWRLLGAGKHPGGWTLVTRGSDFATLAETGRLPRGDVPAKLLGVPRVASTLHANRTPAPAPDVLPHAQPRNEGIPDLETLTRAALRVLERDPDGLFLVIEGGAVDWAMHGNRLGRTIEEMIDFLAAAKTVAAWVEANGGWEENLVVITSDHDHLLLGPDAATVPFDAIEGRGKGKLPGHRFMHSSHSNRLVPLHARGAGAERLLALADEEDPVRGPYIDDTEVFELIRAAGTR